MLIDQDRLLGRLQRLGEVGALETGGRTRLAFDAQDAAGRRLVASWFAEAGLEVAADHLGSLYGRLPGAGTEGAIMSGSHVDTVRAAGALDGCYGVLSALECMQSVKESGQKLPRDLVVGIFTNEEGIRFVPDMLGSRYFIEEIGLEEALAIEDANGVSVGADLAAHGGAGPLGPRWISPAAFVELHIEQGPVLGAEGVSCAAVSGCAGVERHLLTFRGQASHAGTTPMGARRDAGLAAAAAALAIEEVAVRHGGVGTTGRIDLSPGVITAVAGGAELSVDLRHPESDPLADMLSEALSAAASIADDRRCVFGGGPIWRIAPIPFDPELVELAATACAVAGGRAAPIASGALHDAAEMARRVPAAMIFCASREGISHAREEDSSEPDLIAAVEAFGELVAAAQRA